MTKKQNKTELKNFVKYLCDTKKARLVLKIYNQLKNKGHKNGNE